MFPLLRLQKKCFGFKCTFWFYLQLADLFAAVNVHFAATHICSNSSRIVSVTASVILAAAT